MSGTGARGEAVLTANGNTFPILFTNRALAQAEKAIGRPMLQLLQALQNNTLGISDTAQLLAVGMEEGRKDAHTGGRMLTVNDAWAVMDVLGFTTVVSAVLLAIADVLSYGVNSEDNRPPA